VLKKKKSNLRTVCGGQPVIPAVWEVETGGLQSEVDLCKSTGTYLKK
jgi:hypothetical protein